MPGGDRCYEEEFQRRDEWTVRMGLRVAVLERKKIGLESYH